MLRSYKRADQETSSKVRFTYSSSLSGLCPSQKDVELPGQFHLEPMRTLHMDRSPKKNSLKQTQKFILAVENWSLEITICEYERPE